MKIMSSNIATAEYDNVKRELTVTFINRPRWRYIYFKVPPTIWKGFMRAQSKGTYFSSMIRDAYNYRRIIPRSNKK